MSQDIKTVRVKAEPEWESEGARASPYTEPGDVSADPQAGKCDVKEERDSSYTEYKSEDDIYIKYEAEDTGTLVPKDEANSTEYLVVNEEDVPCSSRRVKEEELEVGPEELHRPKPLLATQGLIQQGDQNEQADGKISPGNKHLLALQTNPVGEKLYKCTYCSYATDFQENIKNHVKIHYKCVRCNYKARSEVALQNHISKNCRERTDKYYKCAVCSFSTGCKRYMISHERAHTSENTLKCPDCSYITVDKHLLKIHEKSHISGNIYKCTYCPYATAIEDYLRIHEMRHTGEKPFKCANCSYATDRKWYLKKHVKKHHCQY